MAVGVCGSLESNDCLITVRKDSKNNIEIISDVAVFFKEQIENVIYSVLEELKIKDVTVKIVDKGALDCTIRARLQTALKRMSENDA